MINKKYFSLSLPSDIDIRTKAIYPFTDFNYSASTIIENSLRGNIMNYNHKLVTDNYINPQNDKAVFMTEDGCFYKIEPISNMEAKQNISFHNLKRIDMGIDSSYLLLKNISDALISSGFQIDDNILFKDSFTFTLSKSKLNFDVNAYVFVTDQRRYLKIKFEIDNATNKRSGGRAYKRQSVTNKIYDSSSADIDNLNFKRKYCDSYTGFLKEIPMKEIDSKNISVLLNDIIQMSYIIQNII